MADIINFSLLKFARLAVVPVLNGSVIAGYTAVNFAGSAAFGASEVFAGNIAVFLTYRIGRRNRIIRKFIVFGNLSDESSRSLPVWKLLTEERMEYSTRSVKGLEFVLNVESAEYVVRITYG